MIVSFQSDDPIHKQLDTLYTGNVVAMRDVHRFKDPDYAAYTIRLRERTPANAERLAGELFDRGMVRHWDSDEATVNAIAAAYNHREQIEHMACR